MMVDDWRMVFVEGEDEDEIIGLVGDALLELIDLG
jgi:hypothetical protein